jgi:hypothetical protein
MPVDCWLDWVEDAICELELDEADDAAEDDEVDVEAGVCAMQSPITVLRTYPP